MRAESGRKAATERERKRTKGRCLKSIDRWLSFRNLARSGVCVCVCVCDFGFSVKQFLFPFFYFGTFDGGRFSFSLFHDCGCFFSFVVVVVGFFGPVRFFLLYFFCFFWSLTLCCCLAFVGFHASILTPPPHPRTCKTTNSWTLILN